MLLSRPTPHGIAFLTFLICFLIFSQSVRHWSYRDPGSVFFDPQRAFERRYSLQREAQAEQWIDSVLDGYVKAFPNPSLCVGIPTVQREGARYFRRTIGSVLAGLSVEERKDILLVPFFADIDPSVHAAYHEPWVPIVSDQILTYEHATDDIKGRLNHFLQTDDSQFNRKPLFDYAYLLTQCYNHETPYIVILEDDVIAADGWYLRTRAALEILENIGQMPQTLYLRLFYNERILGWNSEENSTYMFRIALLEGAILFMLMLILRYIPRATLILTPLTILTICLVVTPMCIGLYFAAGRLTVAPPPPGVNRMDAYGCCSQAFVFPREQIPGLLTYYQGAGEGKVDSLTELYANERQMARWAITPSVFAHVGSTSSKESHITRWNRSNTENIWNFSFERFDAEELKYEHVM